LKLLVDNQLPPALARHIDACGTTCIHVRDVGLARALDKTIWDYASSHDMVIVSKDRDFRDMAILRGSPPQVIWVRVANCRRIDLIAAFDLGLQSAKDTLLRGIPVAELR
jgi:predicted nuclease of predicted toxin-antitoxin system